MAAQKVSEVLAARRIAVSKPAAPSSQERSCCDCGTVYLVEAGQDAGGCGCAFL